jgi:hypothetical protein
MYEWHEDEDIMDMKMNLYRIRYYDTDIVILSVQKYFS